MKAVGRHASRGGRSSREEGGGGRCIVVGCGMGGVCTRVIVLVWSSSSALSIASSAPRGTTFPGKRLAVDHMHRSLSAARGAEVPKQVQRGSL